jgi:hypothetical protein
MTTASKTASAIRFILKDYNVWPNGTLDSLLKVYSTKSALDQTKILSIDRSLRRKYLEVDPAYVLPDYKAEILPLTITQPNFNQFFTQRIALAYGELMIAQQALQANPATLPQFELAVEKLEYFTQLYSGLGALQNPQVWTVSDGGLQSRSVTVDATVTNEIISLIIGGGFGDPAIPEEYRNIYVSTQVNSL